MKSLTINKRSTLRGRLEVDDTQVAPSFAKTLRSFTEKQALEDAAAEVVDTVDIAGKGEPAKPAEPVRPVRPVRAPRVSPLAMVKRPVTTKKVDLIAAKKADLIPAEKPVSPKIKAAQQPLGAQLLTKAWKWLQKNHGFSATKQLRVSETVSLGEKRFVAVVHIEGQKFLVGGGSSGVSLLAQLDAATPSDNALQAITFAGSQLQ